MFTQQQNTDQPNQIKKHTCLVKVGSQKSCRTPKQTGQMSESVCAGVTESSSNLRRLLGGPSVFSSPEASWDWGLFSSLMKARSSLCKSYKRECSLLTYTQKLVIFRKDERPGRIVCKRSWFPHSRSAEHISHSSRRTTAFWRWAGPSLWGTASSWEKKEHEGKIYHYMLCNFVLNKCHHI